MQHVRAGSAFQQVIAVVAVENVIAADTGQVVVAVGAVEHIGPVRAGKPWIDDHVAVGIVARRGVQGRQVAGDGEAGNGCGGRIHQP